METVKQFIHRLLALRAEGEYDPEVVSVADSMLCGELSTPVFDIVTSTDRACKEMSRLSRLLHDCQHPVVAAIRLQLEDMRASLKDCRHSAIENLGKRIIPDDLRTYIADFSSVLPPYVNPKQTTCRLTRDPTERGFGRIDPSVVAKQVVELAETCITGSTLLRQAIDTINQTLDIGSYDA